MENLIKIVEKQQKGHENDAIYMIGEQLKEIASRSPLYAEILAQDLEIEGMGLRDAAKKFEEYANKNHGKLKCFCITPIMAEKLLFEMYSLPAVEAVPVQEAPTAFIDLNAFL